MGVITKEKSSVPAPIRLEENFQDYVFSSDEEQETDSPPTVPPPEVLSAPVTPRRRREKKSVRSGLVLIDGLALEHGQNLPPRKGRKQGPGQRKLRRMEHVRQLTTFVDPEDICEDFSDTLPQAVTPFTKLFMEKENMAAWNEFIEKSEAEQEAYLRKPRSKGKKNRCQSEGEGNVLGGRGLSLDQRTAHPAFSGEACFRRVDAKLRDLFRHKHLPMGKVENLENELVDFFLTSSDGVWVNILEDPFDRLLLHGIAQYMSLKSKSNNSGGGGQKRETQVENPKPFFVPPREKLVGFLERTREKS